MRGTGPTITSTIETPYLFVPQSIDGIYPRRLYRRIDPEDQAHGDGDAERDPYRAGGDNGLPLRGLGDQPRQEIAEPNPHHAAPNRDQDRFRQELAHDIHAARPDRPPYTDLLG